MEPSLNGGAEAVLIDGGHLAHLSRYESGGMDLPPTESEYRAIFENTGTATIISEEDTTISLANTEFSRLIGLPLRDVVEKRSWTDFFHPDELPRMWGYHVLRRVHPESVPRTYETRLIDAQGFERDIVVTAALIPGTRRSILSLQDITDKKRSEAALRESEERFRTLVENCLTGISIIQNDEVIYSNPEQTKLSGGLFREGQRVDLRSMHPRDTAKFATEVLDPDSENKESADVVFRFFPNGAESEAGRPNWALCRGHSIQYQGEKAVMINVMDITRLKELEQMIRMQDKMSSLGRVAAGIAHELRNPLSGFNIHLINLERVLESMPELEDSQQEKAGKIIGQLKTASNRVEKVVKRVLDFSRPGSPRLAVADINECVRVVMELTSVTMRKQSVESVVELDPGLPNCYADTQMIEGVLMNLITNALHALEDTPKGRKIGISTRAEGNRIRVAVFDSGPGVPAEIRSRIFDPFFTTHRGGSGIGLSICQRIVTDHGGSLSVSESRWGGAELTFSIPIEKRLERR